MVTYRIRQCSGFHTSAVDVWRRLKDGLEYAEVDADVENPTCYVCFSSTTTPLELSVQALRILKLFGPDVSVGARGCDLYVAFLTRDMFSDPAAILDMLGAMLFYPVDKCAFILPLSNTVHLTKELLELLPSITVPESPLALGVFPTMDDASAFFRSYLGLLLMREISEVLQDIPGLGELEGIISGLNPSGSGDFDFNCTLTSLKPDLPDGVSRDAWQEAVQTLYNRPPPSRFNETSLLESGTQMVLRARRSRKSYLCEDAESDPEDEVMLPDPVVEEVDNWLQCDTCGKWRLVDSLILAEFQDRPFACKDTASKTCDDISDELVPR
jgi:hypothetical protein